MLLALALALTAIVGGALATYLYDEDAPLAARLCAGACVGFAALGLFSFILASVFGFSQLVLIISGIVVAAPLFLLGKAKRRAAVAADIEGAVRGVRRAILHPRGHTTAYALFYLAVALLLYFVFDRAMVELGGIYTGVQNNYGDLPFHLSVITSFSDGANFPPEDPTYAGAHFTYPFIADFVAACFVRAGASLRSAMLLENFVLALSLTGLLHRFTLKLTRDFLAGLIAPLLLLFSGGLGWWQLFADARQHEGGLTGLLLNLEQHYTILPEGPLRWGNSLTTLLVPQRGILLGLALALIVFTLWWQAHEGAEGSKTLNGDKGKGRKPKAYKERKPIPAASSISPLNLFPLSPSAKQMLAAGAIAGLLPLVHAHSFVVVMVVGAGIALLAGLKQWRVWAAFFAVALIIAAPQMLWATRGSSVHASEFFGWHLGWDRKEENIFWFWFLNTGLFIPLIVAAIFWRNKGRDGRKYLVSRPLLYFYLPFTLCFIIPNLIKLAPWVWDNIKVIFYWYVASIPLVALLLARLWREGRSLRAVSGVLLLTLTLAGMLDVWSVMSRAVDLRIFDADGVAFSQVVKEKTEPRATILHAPTFDTPIFLTGRRSLMGYPGHISSHGLRYEERQREIVKIYSGTAEAEKLLAKYNVRFVVTGPQERSVLSQLRATVNDSFFARYPIVGEIGEYRLYEITRP